MGAEIPPEVLFLFRALHAEMNISLIVIGIQMFMCIYGLSLFFESSPSERQGRTLYILVSWAIFLLFTLGQTINSNFVFNIVSGLVGLEEAKQDALMITGVVTTAAINWLGDGLLLWRAYIIWIDKRWVLVLPTLAYLASFVMSILQLIPSVTHDPSGNPTFTSTWIYLTIAVNASITFLITLRLLQARRQLRSVFSGDDLKVYTGVVAILLESAMPLSVSGLVFAAVYDPKNVDQQIVKTTFLCLYFSLSALAPQIIIFRVTTGRSSSRPRLSKAAHRHAHPQTYHPNHASSPYVGQMTTYGTRSLQFAHSTAMESTKDDNQTVGMQQMSSIEVPNDGGVVVTEKDNDDGRRRTVVFNVNV